MENVIIVLHREYLSNEGILTQKLFESKSNSFWETQSHLIIIVRKIPGKTSENIAKLVIKTLWVLIKAANVLIMIIEDDKFLFFKWYPYAEDCDVVNKVNLVNEWQNGNFKQNYPLFSQMSTNLNGCKLSAGTVACPPYVIEPEKPNEYKEGLDIRLAQSLAEYFNFKIKYIELPENMSPYIIYQNGKPSGFHEMLHKQELDMMLFGVRINDLRNQIADPLDSYTEDALVWVVPTPHLKPHWTSISNAFTNQCWILISVFFIICTVTMILITHIQSWTVEHPFFRTASSCMLTSVGIMLNCAVPHPKSTLLRLFIFMFSMFAINLTSAYQSSLITLLTGRRYYKVFETPMDAVEGGVTTYLFPSGKNTYNQTDFDMWNIILQPGRHVYSEDYISTLKKIANNKSAMILMAENPAKYEISTRFMTKSQQPKILILKEKFSYYKVTVYMSLGHPMYEHFKRKVNQLVEGGIVEHWLKEVFSLSSQNLVTDDDSSKILTVLHLEGAFFIWGFFLLVSFLVFCCELIYYRLSQALKCKSIKWKKF